MDDSILPFLVVIFAVLCGNAVACVVWLVRHRGHLDRFSGADQQVAEELERVHLRELGRTVTGLIGTLLGLCLFGVLLWIALTGR